MRIIRAQVWLLLLSTTLFIPSLAYAHPASVEHTHAFAYSPGDLSIILIVAAAIVVLAALAGRKAFLKATDKIQVQNSPTKPVW